MKNVIKNFFATVIKSFFYSRGKFQPAYFWTTVFLVMINTTWIMKLSSRTKVDISDTLLLGLLGFVAVWLGIYNWQKNKEDVQNNILNLPTPPQVTNVMEKVGVIEQAVVDKLSGKKGGK